MGDDVQLEPEVDDLKNTLSVFPFLVICVYYITVYKQKKQAEQCNVATHLS
jgi:hypothetical protein